MFFFDFVGFRDSRGGVTFGGIFEKCAVFLDKVVPLILSATTTFWPSFRGAGHPGR